MDKKTKLITAMLFLSVVPLLASDNWQKAVEIYSENNNMKPHTVRIFSQTFDKRGTLEKTEEQIYMLEYSLDSEDPERILVRATEDGKDITEKKRKELEKEKNKNRQNPMQDVDGMDKHPLDPEAQNDLNAFFSGKIQSINGIDCEVWDFELSLNEKYRSTGSAWLNRETGETVTLEYSIEPLFPFVEEMKISMNFSTMQQGKWLLDRLEMDGKVNMVFIKRRFASVMEFSDYR